ncbi:hypothetical protein FHQ18_06565 [Deferribacter autotrophicus]|uniref:Uncharacterized protein n=1 Tax=Deferribacter autotrophicus TaxID=500465 RepID=A0A5A8F5R5_9BACT|nr:hypothetical protein [Deferribacter autotrophicus]KAA0258054.1 hypothetical protein FHQ18_06565 [Deferribacter autotrophicus]
MSTSFRIVAEKLLLFLEELNEMEINDEFFLKVKMYENFLNQLLQITEKMDTIDEEGKKILMDINEKNNALLSRLKSEKDNLKNDILKVNRKENLKKKYYN